MYNRYLSGEEGPYLPISEEPCETAHGPASPTGSSGGLFRTLLDRFHLDNIDSGDLLLLGLLFFLYREGADEELLMALGLLLIL